jgi:hypothetical protein
MAYEDPNAPAKNDVNSSSGSGSNSTATSEKKPNSWDWIWPTIVAVIIVKLFGLVGGLVTLGSYYWLKPKLGTWGSVGASGVIGIVVAVGLLAMIR